MQRLSYDQRVYTVFGIDIGIFKKKKSVPGKPQTTKAEEVLPTSDFRLPISNFRLPTSNFRLLTSDF